MCRAATWYVLSMRRVRGAVALACLAAAACSQEAAAVPQAAGLAALPDPVERPVAATSRAATPPPRAAFVRCRDHTPATSAAGFAHRRSKLIARSWVPRHYAHDVAAAPGGTVVVEGKFSYGDQGKDLEDEPVAIWLDDCQNISRVASAETDDDGRARIEIAAPQAPGEYGLHFVVDGDASSTRASLWVVEPGTPIVVFDIDGTLTVSDAEVNLDVLDQHFDKMLEGDYQPQVYADGATLASTWVDKGVLPVYLSGRPYWLVQYSRDWLVAENFPRGLVRTCDKHREVVPRIDGVGRFKAGTLKRMLELGVVVQAAYGNATTDIWAYAEAGIPVERTFIIGPHAGEGGTRALAGAWTDALPWAREQPIPSGALGL
jgi:hypothetical protein